MEFVDDIADPNNGYFEALKSNQTISSIQKRKRLTFSAEKCKILKIVQTTPIDCFCQVSNLRQILSSDILVIFSIIRRTILDCVKTVPERRQAPAMKLFH